MVATKEGMLAIWAETLAQKGTPGPEETEDLLEMLLPGNTKALAAPSATAQQEALLPLCSFLSAASKAHDPMVARASSFTVRSALVSCVEALPKQLPEDNGVWALAAPDLFAVMQLLEELIRCRVLDDTEAARVSASVLKLLCAALEEHVGAAASSADLSALTPRGAMLSSVLRCAAGRGATTSPAARPDAPAGLPLLGADALEVLKAAAKSLKEGGPAKSMTSKQERSHEELVMGLIGRLLQTRGSDETGGSAAPDDEAAAASKAEGARRMDLLGAGEGSPAEVEELIWEVLSLASQRVRDALRVLRWTSGDAGAGLGSMEGGGGDGATAATAAPVLAAAAVRLCGGPEPSEETLQRVVGAAEDLTLLSEACARAVWPVGVGSPTSKHLLELSKLALFQGATVIRVFVVAGGTVSSVPFSRLMKVVVEASKLMQEAQVPDSEWDWNLEARCLVADYSGVFPTTALTRAAVQAMVDAMGAAWTAGHEAAVKALLLPSLDPKRAMGAESMPLPMLAGRLCIAVKGEEGLSRVVLPLLIDRLQAAAEPRSPVVMRRVLHTLGKVAVAAAHSGDKWAYGQVLDLLVKLYKEPRSPISQPLMHSGSTSPQPQAGALAKVLADVASSLGGSPMFLQDLLDRLLRLFCDFGLKMVAPQAGKSKKKLQKLPMAAAADLAEILPAVAAALELLESPAEAQEGGDAASAAAETFEEMEAGLRAAQGRTQLFRILWMYCALLGLTPVPVALKWEGCSEVEEARRGAWQEALGTVAVNTVPILVEPGRQEQEVLVDNRTRLQLLGEPGSPAAVRQGLAAVASLSRGGAPGSVQGTAPERGGYLLAVAGLELMRASTSQLSDHIDGSHMAELFSYLHRKSAPDHAFLKCVTSAVFEAYLRRVRHPKGSVSVAPEVQQARESLAGVLMANLNVRNSNEEISRFAEVLLSKLVESCPALPWSRQIMLKLLEMDSTPSCSHLAKLWMATATRTAPMAAEAVLHEELRLSCGGGGMCSNGGLGAEMLSAASSAGGPADLTGLQALGRKLHYCGVASGLEASRVLQSSPTTWSMASDMLKSAASKEDFDSSKLQECYLQAVAVLVEHGSALGNADYFQLLRLLVWVPDKFMDPETVRMVAFGLTWVSIGAPDIAANMLSELGSMWVASINKRVGMFAGGSISERDTPPAELLRSIEAQTVILCFLEEQWALNSAGALPQADAAMVIFLRMLEVSLHQTPSLLLHPCCTVPFFKLLTIALQYCKIKSGMTVKPPAVDSQTPLLFSRVIRAALLWFTMPPLFYQGEPSDTTFNERSVMAVEAFTSVLQTFNPLPVLNLPGADEARQAHPVWRVFENGSQASEALRDRVALLQMLLTHETDRLKVWTSPLVPVLGASGSSSSSSGAGGGATSFSATQWNKLMNVAWQVDPKLAVALKERHPSSEEASRRVGALVAAHATETSVKGIPAAATLLAAHCRLHRGQRRLLEHLSGWKVAPLVSALKLMNEDAEVPEIRSYALRSLHACDPEEVAFYLPQLVQALRHDKNGDLKVYLKAAASQSYIFCHRLVWNLQSEETPPEEAFNPEVKRSGWEPPKDTGLWNIVTKVKEELLQELSARDKDYLSREFGYFDGVTKISGYLKKYEKAERPFRIGGYLKEIQMQGEDLYLPTNPDSRVLKLLPESGTPMQSAAKVPILVAFEVEAMGTHGNPDEAGKRYNQACIFKVGDDCRQDVMALQVIDLLKQVFTAAGLDVFLAPYGVLPTGYECGIIEVVPNSASRAGLGETSENGLHDIFEREFGAPGSARFEEARLNFIKSSAGYAVASFFLQAKDRHNGNILLDTRGNLIHIDFGFVLEISPGNNMRFESAAFKLSHEMCQLLDPAGNRTSPSFKLFEELCVKGYLAARTNVDAIMAAVALMAESGLPCFGRGEPINNLYNRFHLEKTDQQAAEFMRGTIADAYDKWTTRFYDVIQWYQQGIEK